MTDCLSMVGVWKSYAVGVRGCSGTVAVLRDLTLHATLGEIITIAAAPAAGKSTLLMCAAGLLRPDRGTISWFGGAPLRDAIARPYGIAYASDRPFPYGFLTVREALEYAAIVRDLPVRDNGNRVAIAMARTGLDPIAHRRVDELDAAALARLGLASALLSNPRLLLVDDLSPGTDVDTAADVVALLRAVAAEGAAVVVVGRFAARLASSHGTSVRVYALVNGRLESVADVGTSGGVRTVSTVPHARVAETRSPSAARDIGAR